MPRLEELPIIRYETTIGIGKGISIPQKGYRYGTPKKHYDLSWTIISEHYVITEELKTSRKRDTFPVEVYDLNVGEDSVDKRCLQLLKTKLVEWGVDKEQVESAANRYSR